MIDGFIDDVIEEQAEIEQRLKGVVTKDKDIQISNRYNSLKEKKIGI